MDFFSYIQVNDTNRGKNIKCRVILCFPAAIPGIQHKYLDEEIKLQSQIIIKINALRNINNHTQDATFLI